MLLACVLFLYVSGTILPPAFLPSALLRYKDKETRLENGVIVTTVPSRSICLRRERSLSELQVKANSNKPKGQEELTNVFLSAQEVVF